MRKQTLPSQARTRLLRLIGVGLIWFLAVFGATISPGSGGIGPSIPPAHAATQPRLSAHSQLTAGSAGTLSPNLPSPTVLPPADPSRPATEHQQYKYEALGISPSGPLYSTEPFLSRLSASSAWNKAVTTNPAPTVAVIDTGFALNHEDLVNRWDGTQGAGSWEGWDFVDNTDNPMAGKIDPAGAAVFHGTMTAGLAGLLDPNAKLMPLQALGDDGVGYTDEIAAAVAYAADHGANIISMSLGSSQDDPYLHQEIDYAISKGALVVAAAGNSGCNCLSYPAAYPEVLSVGASDQNDLRAGFSSYGSNLDVLAPGTAGDVCSAFYTPSNATNAYSCGYSGTSFATPITSGLAALLLQQTPELTQSDLLSIITQTADKTAAMGGQNRTLSEGYGRIDASAAVVAASLANPQGQLLSRSRLSLSGATLATGPQMDSTCIGLPGATCDITLTGPLGQIVDLGSKTLDSTYGGADYVWNAATLGLTAGRWTIVATITANGQTTTTPAQSLTANP